MASLCPHPAKVRTLVGTVLMCAKCARPYFPPPHYCSRCGWTKEINAGFPPELRRRFRFYNGRPLCNVCRRRE